MAAWNAAFTIVGLLLIALAGEAYLRSTSPFISNNFPSQFVDGVGVIRKPKSELRYANWHDDKFVVSRANSQGFLDREPITPERAAAGCHITFIGDSFVEAREVSIADKFHVRLEEKAARELPRMNISTQAYGTSSTAQINQLPFYDEYARRLNPKLVVLTFYINDFFENSTTLMALVRGIDPDKMPHMTAQKDTHGDIKLRPPDPEYEHFLLPRQPKPRYAIYWNSAVRVSYFAKWLEAKGLIRLADGEVKLLNFIRILTAEQDSRYARWAAMIAERPCCASLLSGWKPKPDVVQQLFDMFAEERLPPAFQEALDYTEFGIDQFKRRTDRDGARLIILAATKDMGTPGDPQFDRLSAIAEARGIPIISDYAYILSQGRDVEDARWRSDNHWNPTGHQWAAEAVLEWLKANQQVCD